MQGLAHRLPALDVFRGATLAGMLLVNNPGDWNHLYAPLRHAAWHGWTFADLIFPFFLWIVGFSLTLSLGRRRADGCSLRVMERHLLLRGLTLFALGLFLAGFPFGLAFDHPFAWTTLRIPGVLQRIALCLLLTGLLLLHTPPRTQALTAGSLLALYWLLLALIPVPGYGAGVLAPQGNLAWYLDATLLAGHTWQGAPVPGFDPEGLLSTLPALASTLMGALAGHFVQSARPVTVTSGWLAATGLGLVVLGWIADHWLPINKNLWTSSYALFTAGLAQGVFAGCHWGIERRGPSRWSRPLAIFGQNALALFFLAGLLARLTMLIKVGEPAVAFKTFYYQLLFRPWLDPLPASFLHAVAFVLFMYAVAYALHQRHPIISGSRHRTAASDRENRETAMSNDR